MADYQKMYAYLCGAIDDVLDDLNKIPLATPSAYKLQKAMLDAEKLYVEAEEPVIHMADLKKENLKSIR